jgi:hypothetical protein
MTIRRGLTGKGYGKLKRAKLRNEWRRANVERHIVRRCHRKLKDMMNTYNETDLELIQRYGALEVIKQYGDNAAIHAIAQACLRNSDASATAVYNIDRATLVPPSAPEPTLLYPTWVAEEQSTPHRSRLYWLPAAVMLTIFVSLAIVITWLVYTAAIFLAIGAALFGVVWLMSLRGKRGSGHRCSGTWEGRVH